MAFIDSAGFIALYVADDEHHQEAIACRERTLRFSRLYTSSAVVAETLAHIQRSHHIDQECLQRLIHDFLQINNWMTLLLVDKDASTQAMQMVRERNDRRFSFVDATNILLMEKHKIDIIFSYDTLYDGVDVRRGYNSQFITRIGP